MLFACSGSTDTLGVFENGFDNPVEDLHTNTLWDPE